MSLFSVVVAMELTQPLWPRRTPLRVSESDMVMDTIPKKEKERNHTHRVCLCGQL
jgi:hypothetical protein